MEIVITLYLDGSWGPNADWNIYEQKSLTVLKKQRATSSFNLLIIWAFKDWEMQSITTWK